MRRRTKSSDGTYLDGEESLVGILGVLVVEASQQLKVASAQVLRIKFAFT